MFPSFRFLKLLALLFVVGFGFHLLIASANASTPSSVTSIDQCLRGREYAYNDVFNVWVSEFSLVRCKKVGKELRALSGSFERFGDTSLVTDVVAACVGKVDGEIIAHGEIQRNVGGRTFNGRIWEEKCGALGALPGRNHLMVEEVDDLIDPLGTTFGTGGTTYTGGGLAVPDDRKYDLKGISKSKDLKQLVIGWTNFLLPYVSVLSVFAVVAAGLFYIVSIFNEELNAKAKNILIYVVIGIVLIFSAYTIVNTLLDISRL
jgi:hypothetical protein